MSFLALVFFKGAYFLQRSFLVQHGAVDIITLEGATNTCDNTTLSPARNNAKCYRAQGSLCHSFSTSRQ